MEKRVLLAVVLSFIVLYGYQALFMPPKPQPAQEATTPAAPGPDAAKAPAQPVQTPTPEAPPVQTPAAPVVADTAERDVVFENAAVAAVFTTRGGALKSWRLKHYQDATGKPLDLIPSSVPANTPRPLDRKSTR